MLIFLGTITTAGGLVLFLWYRTVVALPLNRQPPFIHITIFKWGMPGVCLGLFLSGIFLLGAQNIGLAIAGAILAALFGFLVIRFDRYSAEMRMIHDQYKKIRTGNSGMEELEVLFHTARWRYPGWSDDRALELVVGKDIEHLILLMLVSENKINPISDWELYRALKMKVARVTRSTSAVKL